MSNVLTLADIKGWVVMDTRTGKQVGRVYLKCSEALEAADALGGTEPKGWFRYMVARHGSPRISPVRASFIR